MNAEVRTVKTIAEQALADAYVQARTKLPGDGKVTALRDAAFRHFEAIGLPHRRIEEWKYTDLRALLREAYPLAAPPDAAAKARAKAAETFVGDIEARRIVFVDGTFVPELSDLAGLSPGLSIRTLADALAAGDPLVAAHLGKVVPSDEGVVALNTAMMRDGAVISVAAGATVERPIHLVFAATGERPSSVFARSLAVIGEGARAMLVESHVATAAHQINTALELVIGERAHVDHIKITGGSTEAVHVSSLMVSLAGHARFNDFIVQRSAAACCAISCSCASMAKARLPTFAARACCKGRQHADTTLVVDHKVGGCQSREVFKSVLDDESRGVFQGKIIVRPKAQKTDARMMTQALLLSDEAEADNKPELEIFADDVQCGHGATSGALDENLKFYLMARGIPEPEAEALLVQAFVGDAVEGIEHAGLRDALMEHVAAWLKARDA